MDEKPREEHEQIEGAEDDEELREQHDEIRRDDEAVEQASEDSFPASDPPSYSGTTGGSKEDDGKDED